ncbi:HET domain-containing protein [Microdochium nivale]|nr:HET domain-containing protein [Microdochium nivale]
MRLLNAKSHGFEEFYGHEIPQYAILSHTWQRSQEVTYHEWLAGPTDKVKARSGFRKIRDACSQALTDGFDWIWVDTNCIDKSSSAELSEAINSMFSWYHDAAICYVHLQDVPPIDNTEDDEHKHFRASRWWTRGWTLQELLAPRRLVFFASDWSHMGSRDVLASEIKRVTGINAWNCQAAVQEASVARKMSWLSQRETTRVEDMAYCMLGLFDINMPLLYGEGSKAFIRLQEEIIKKTADVTIFCWTRDESTPQDWLGLLAPNPRAFAHSAGFYRYLSRRLTTPWSITNQGLSISLPVVHTFEGAYLWLYEAGTKQIEKPDQVVAIPISARDQVWHGHFRLTCPPGPVIFSVSEAWAEPPFVLPAVSEGRSIPKLRLSPTRESLTPEYVNDLILRLKTPAMSQSSNLLFLIDERVPQFFATHVDITSELMPAADGMQNLSEFIVAPSAVAANPITGLVKLAEVAAGKSRILAGAIELSSNFTSYGGSTNCHVRIFLAFEAPETSTRNINGHYCAVSYFTTVRGAPNLDGAEVRPSRRPALKKWYEERLERVRSGHTSHQPKVVWSQDGGYALRVLRELAEAGDCAPITVVLLKQDPAQLITGLVPPRSKAKSLWVDWRRTREH